MNARKKHGRVTIGDVAAQAGVSVATVSKVINDRYGVAEDTSARVRAVIDDLGYHASLVGQSLRSRRTKVIGVLVATSSRSAPSCSRESPAGSATRATSSSSSRGCGQAADQAGWERRYLSRISGTLADGAILVTPGSIDETFGAPVVAVDHNARSSTLPTVDSENLKGAVAATEYLLGLGHRRIGFLAGRPRPRVGEPARARATGRRSPPRGSQVDESLDPGRRLRRRDRDRACTPAARARPASDRDLRCERRDRARDDGGRDARSASASRRTCPSSASTTCPSRRWAIRR